MEHGLKTHQVRLHVEKEQVWEKKRHIDWMESKIIAPNYCGYNVASFWTKDSRKLCSHQKHTSKHMTSAPHTDNGRCTNRTKRANRANRDEWKLNQCKWWIDFEHASVHTMIMRRLHKKNLCAKGKMNRLKLSWQSTFNRTTRTNTHTHRIHVRIENNTAEKSQWTEKLSKRRRRERLSEWLRDLGTKTSL